MFALSPPLPSFSLSFYPSLTLSLSPLSLAGGSLQWQARSSSEIEGLEGEGGGVVTQEFHRGAHVTAREYCLSRRECIQKENAEGREGKEREKS